MSKSRRKFREIFERLTREEMARIRWIEANPRTNGPAPERPWGKCDEAPREPPWFGVQRLGPYGRVNRRAMFRHATREEAEREAQFLAEYYSGGVFAVVEALSVHIVGEPEVRIGQMEAAEEGLPNPVSAL